MTLKEARKRVGLRQGDVARIVGVDHVTVSNWERGVTSPTAKRLLQLCKLYRVEPGEIDFKEREVKSYGDDMDGLGTGLGRNDEWADGPDD